MRTPWRFRAVALAALLGSAAGAAGAQPSEKPADDKDKPPVEAPKKPLKKKAAGETNEQPAGEARKPPEKKPADDKDKPPAAAPKKPPRKKHVRKPRLHNKLEHVKTHSNGRKRSSAHVQSRGD